MMKKIIISCVVVGFILLGAFWFLTKRTAHNERPAGVYFTVNELGCKVRRGRVAAHAEDCKSNESNIGFIEGIKCSCFCCVPN